MEQLWSPAAVNWARLVRATLGRDHNSSSPQRRAAIVEQFLQAADDIGSDDRNVARILCEHAYTLAQSLDPGSCDGLDTLKYRTGLACVTAQKHAKKGGVAMINRQNDTLSLWIFYVEYMSLLRADGTHLEPGRLWESRASKTEMGASYIKMKKIYTTLRALLGVLEIAVGNPPTDILGRKILEEIRRMKETGTCSTTYWLPPTANSSSTMNWERLVRAALKHQGVRLGLDPSIQCLFRKATIIKHILQAADDIDSDDPDIARILCDQAYDIAANLDLSSSDWLGALKFRTGIASVVAQERAKKDGCKIDRQNDIQNFWKFYMGYMSLLRTDGVHLEPARLRASETFGPEMGASDMEMEKIYATLRVLLYVLENLVKESPTDRLGKEILHEIRTIKDSDACSIVARYRMDHIMHEDSQEPTNLPLTMLKDITNDFSDEREIGRGGYAVVYKGVLQDGIIAVKKISNNHTIDDSAFYHETTFLMSVKHKNVVRFLGFCAHTEKKAMKWEEPQKYIYVDLRERLLCFEYMRRGSLSNHVTDELRGLEWHTRFKIIRGLCDGLCYLHKEKNIVHRDLKPGNVLLDDLMVPKIADFGISKFLEGVTHSTTSNRTGSLGYCPHEFQRFGKVSLKTDVYSLGVIIVEIVTGYREDPSIKNVLRRWRYRWNKSGSHRPIAEEQIQRCIHVAVRCMDDDPNRRPYIWNIVDDLSEVEPTIGHINLQNANESTASHQVMPFPLEMLGIEPLEPHFPFETNKQRTCSLELTNVRGDNIGFRIDTIGPRKYHIKPNKGVVPPQCKSTVCITVQEHEKTPQGRLCKDEFVLWSTRVDEGLTAEDIIKATFNKEGGKEVDEVYLSVVFDAPPFTELQCS